MAWGLLLNAATVPAGNPSCDSIRAIPAWGFSREMVPGGNPN